MCKCKWSKIKSWMLFRAESIVIIVAILTYTVFYEAKSIMCIYKIHIYTLIHIKLCFLLIYWLQKNEMMTPDFVFYLNDRRFRDESFCSHNFNHSLRHHSLLHAWHVKIIDIVPECNAVFVLLCVTHCCQADVTEIWINCGETRSVKTISLLTMPWS